MKVTFKFTSVVLLALLVGLIGGVGYGREYTEDLGRSYCYSCNKIYEEVEHVCQRADPTSTSGKAFCTKCETSYPAVNFVHKCPEPKKSGSGTVDVRVETFPDAPTQSRGSSAYSGDRMVPENRVRAVPIFPSMMPSIRIYLNTNRGYGGYGHRGYRGYNGYRGNRGLYHNSPYRW